MQLEDDFKQFIEFGNIFDRPTRTYLVQYLHQKFKPTSSKIESLLQTSSEFEYLKDALDKIFDNQQLVEASRQNENLRQEIMKDAFKWMRQALQKAKSDSPYEEEQKELERWHTRPTFMWVKHWYKLTNYLRDIYIPEEIDTRFYEQKFEQLTKDIDAYTLERDPKSVDKYKVELKRLDILIEDLLNRWQSLLTAKRLAHELDNIDKQREQFCELLYAKVEEFLKLLEIITPFQAEVGRYWDMSRGLWQKASFNILQKYSELLQKEESIQELADLLGRMREAETELEEETFAQVITKKTWIDDPQLKSEIGGIHESNHLPKVLPSEVSFLGYPETESVFYKKLADHSLLTFQEQGRSLVVSNKVNYYTQQKERRKEKGPFIICIDTSGSMEGLPEQIAKVLCFAILKMASREQRKCFLISFSVGIKTINLLDLANSMDEIVKFLSMSFHGGTDVTPAMMATLSMLETNDYKDADVLMVSDFVMFEIREEVTKKMRRQQEKDTKFHSLTISKQPNPEIIHKFDNNWIYNPEDRGIVKQLAKDLQEFAI
jgi:uncharacterized protein with von Willebrand factor type A (vWA) domain